MRIRKILRWVGAVAAVMMMAQLAGCGGGGNADAPQGKLLVTMTNTNAQTCSYDEVNISVSSVRANQNASAGPNDGNWQPRAVTVDYRTKANLGALTINSSKDIVTIELPAGHYAQIRLWLEQEGPLSVNVNSVVHSGTIAKLDTSRTTSIGVPVEFDIPANGQAGLILDFDACGSVVNNGDGTFQLAPSPLSITAKSTSGA